MYAFHIAAALVKPAAGMIHEAAGVCEVDLFRQAQGIKLLKSTQRPMQGTL